MNNEEVTELSGKMPGPTSMVIVGVHGDERCGVDALQAMLPTLQISAGRVFFAYGNPRAIEKNVRFTETNLNRMFKDSELLPDNERSSYEFARAQFLKKYLDKAEALLDVHASFTPKSRKFIICEKNGFEVTKALPFDTIVTGFDTTQPGGTDYYMNAKGKIGICVECGFLGDPSSTAIAKESILRFLEARGHISPRDLPHDPQAQIRIYEMYLTKTNSFTLVKAFEDFEEIKEGEIIGLDGTEEVRAPKDSLIFFARDRTTLGDEAFLLGCLE